MRLLAIRGKNLNSLAGSFAIELDQPPLADAGLYAIIGPTGAGKSTLFDAACLALFGHIPRLYDAGKLKIGDELDEDLTRSDSRNILRRGTSDGYAEVDFIGVDQQRYRSRWSVRRARDHIDGKLQSATIGLWNDAGQPLSEATSSATYLAIQERLGLDFAQFRRTVLLAQGEFAAFLRAKGKERAELLERLTDTDVYSRLSKRAFDKTKEAKLALDQACFQREALIIPSAEEREREFEAGELAKRQGLDAQQREQSAQAAIEWFKQVADLTNVLNETSKISEALEVRWIASLVDRERLEKWKAFLPHRDFILAFAEAYRRVEPLTQSVAIASQQSSEAYLHVETTKKRLEADKQQQQSHQQRLQQQKPILEQARRLEYERESVQKEISILQTKMNDNKQEQTIIARELHKIEDQLHLHLESAITMEHQQPLAESWKPALANRAILSAELETRQQIQQQLHQLHIQLLQDKSKLDDLREQYQLAITQLTTCQYAIEQAIQTTNLSVEHQNGQRDHLEQERIWLFGAAIVERFLHHRQSWELRIQQLYQEMNSEKHTCELEKIRFIALEQAWKASEPLKTEPQFFEQRKQLTATLPCPLCGSRDHPYTDSPSHCENSTEIAAVIALEHQYTQSKILLGESLTRLKLLSARLEDASSFDAALQLQLDPLYVTLQLPRSINLIQLQSFIQQRRDQFLEMKQITQPTHATNQTITLTTHNLLDLQANSRKAQTHVEFLRNQLEQAQEQLTDRRHQHQELSHRESGIVSYLAALLPNEGIQCVQEQRSLEPLFSHYALWWEKSQTVHVRTSELQQQLIRMQERAQAMDRYSIELKEEYQTRQQQAERLLNEIRLLVGNTPIAIQLDQLERNGIEIQEKIKLQSDKLQQDRERLSRLFMQSELALAQQRQLCEQLLIYQTEAEQRNIDIPEDWHEITSKRVSEIEKQQETLTIERTNRIRRQTEIKSEIDKYQTMHPSGTPQQWSLSLQQAIEEGQSAQRRIGAVEASISQWNLLIARATMLEQQIQLLEASYQQCEALSLVIGSADGSSFRTFAQGLVFGDLISAANEHLMILTPRYALEAIPGADLELRLIDHELGGERRPAEGLSGGESFLISLALALGLSSRTAVQTPIETLLIDEGFGSLDPETLDIALVALDSLRATGLKIGIISHLPDVQEYVDATIRIVRVGPGTSKVEISRKELVIPNLRHFGPLFE